MSKSNILNKIKLLDVINIDIWIKKKITQNKRVKNIYILDSLRDAHRDIIDNFIKAVNDNSNKISIEFLQSNIIEELYEEKNSEITANINLVFCTNNIKNRASEALECKGNLFFSSNNSIFLFNTLLSSDKITKDIKRSIWENFIFLKNYE